MLTNLTPPTDSVYKFLAITGLILFLAGWYFSTIEENESNLTYLSLQQEQNYLVEEVRVIQDEMVYNLEYRPYYDSLTEHFGITDSMILDPEMKDSMAAHMIFSAPEGIKEKYIELRLKKKELEGKKALIKEKQEHSSDKNILFMISLVIGEVLAIFGFILWYHKIQKPQDEKQKKELEDNRIKHCQSCFKTFIFENEKALEKDGSQSEFCTDCYSNGKYTEPELTLEEAKSRLKENLESLNYPSKTKRKRLEEFEFLNRWRRKRNW